MNQNVSRRHVLVNNEPITSEAQGVTGYYLETENADQRGAKLSRDVRVESTNRKSLQTRLSSSKKLGKKVFMTIGPNLVNVQTFEFGESGFWTKMDICLDSKACTSETIDRIDPKTFFCLVFIHKKMGFKRIFDLSSDE